MIDKNNKDQSKDLRTRSKGAYIASALIFAWVAFVINSGQVVVRGGRVIKYGMDSPNHGIFIAFVLSMLAIALFLLIMGTIFHFKAKQTDTKTKEDLINHNSDVDQDG